MEPLTTPRLVLKRLSSNWRLMLAIFVGIVVATTLVSAAPIYMRSLERLGVNTAIERSANVILNVHVFSPHIPLTAKGLEDSQQVLKGAIDRHISDIYRGQRRFLRSDTFLMGLPDRPLEPKFGPVGGMARGYVQHMSELEKHVVFVQGRMATSRVTAGPTGPELEVVLGTPSLEVFDLKVGDRVEVTPFMAHPTRLTAHIVGLFEPADPTEEYWRHNANVFLRPEPPHEVPEVGITVYPEEPPVPFFTTEVALLEAVGDSYPESLINSTWLLFVDKGALKEWSITESRQRFARFEAAITGQLPGSAVLSGVKRLLNEFERRSLFTGIPLLLLLVLMVVTVLYYLLMMVSYLVQSREGEVALLRTRGVSTWQLLRLYATESAVLTTIAVAVAPFLAMALVALSGKVPYFREITGGDMLPVRLEGLPFLVALPVGAACLAIYVLSGVLGARASLIVHRLRSSRPPATPLFQRYFLDVALLAIGGLVFWELYTRGNLASGGLFTGVQVNESLLLAPVLFLVVVALVFMRLFPLLVSFVGGESAGLLHIVVAATVLFLSVGLAIKSVLHEGGLGWMVPSAVGLALGGVYWATWQARRLPTHVAGLVLQAGLVAWYLVLEPPRSGEVLYVPKVAAIAITPAQVLFLLLRQWVHRAPIWISVGLWHMARNPLQYSWLVLLLVLITGLGVLSTTVGGTLDRSYQDRISYETATDIRVSGIPGDIARGNQALKERYLRIPGVKAVSVGLRGSGNLGSTGSGSLFQVLGVESANFSYISWFRDDFSAQPLGALMHSIQVGPLVQPLTLPEGATHMGVYAKPSDTFGNIFLWMVLEDRLGVITTITLGSVGPPQWHLMRAEVPARLVPPVRLLSIQLFEPAYGPGGTSGFLLLDDVHAVTGPEGKITVLEDFEGKSSWVPLATSALSSDVVGPTTFDVLGGERSGLFTFGKDTDKGVRGFYYSPSGGSLPVIVSRSFTVESGAGPGDSLIVGIMGSLLSVRVRGVVDYFPTLDPNRGPFVVADLEELMRHLRLVTPTSKVTINELFVTHAPRAHQAVAETLDEGLGRVFSIQIFDREARMEALRLDPLVTAGWKAMVLLSLVVMVLTAGLGYATYLLSFAGRSRGEMAFLQTLGLSRRQMLGLVGLEQGVMVLLGLSLGTWAGFQMSSLMVRSVAVTERGGQVVPPFVLITDWSFMGPIYAVLAVIFAGAVWVLHRGVTKLELHSVVRSEAG